MLHLSSHTPIPLFTPSLATTTFTASTSLRLNNTLSEEQHHTPVPASASASAPAPSPQFHPKMTDFDKPHVPAPTREDYYASRGRVVFTVFLILLLLIGAVALVLYLLYRPEKPRFAVVAAAVYDLNVTSSTLPPLVSATMQFTLLTKNPNRRARAYYDRLRAYVSYKDHPLTQPVGLPPLNLDEREGVAMSPVMGGGMPVEVAEQAVNGLEMDEGYGVVGLRVVVIGRLRWRAGVFWSEHRRLSVMCDVLMGLRKGHVGRVPLLATPPCKVDA